MHHGRQYTIMTNDPAYDEQLALLAKQDFTKPASDMPLPGNVNPKDRFQRATYYSALLPKPKNGREGRGEHPRDRPQRLGAVRRAL